jgi:hypothetical protein
LESSKILKVSLYATRCSWLRLIHSTVQALTIEIDTTHSRRKKGSGNVGTKNPSRLIHNC